MSLFYFVSFIARQGWRGRAHMWVLPPSLGPESCGESQPEFSFTPLCGAQVVLGSDLALRVTPWVPFCKCLSFLNLGF